jgi:hypothetical protein
MKWLPLTLLLLPVFANAQNKSDFENAMATFKKFYNAGQGDSINKMFGQSWEKMKATTALWTNEDNKQMLEKYGVMQSFKFIGIDKTDPKKVYVFKTVFSKGGEQTTSLTLDKKNKFKTFRFITFSDGIAKLIKKNREENKNHP